MKLSRIARPAGLSAVLLLLFACGGAPPPPPQEPKPGPAPAPEATTGGARDPKIAELAKAVLACKFEEGAFDDECAAYKAWSDNEELFADGKGNDTLLSMLGDPDVKIRLLVDRKSIDHAYFEDKAHAAKLFALAKDEKDDSVAHALGGYVAKVDAEKLGLQAELRALAKHPSTRFRDALAFYLISTYQTPVALEVEQMLIDDAEVKVKESAVSALSTGGITPGVEPVCKLLTKQLGRADDLAAEALWAGTSSKCAGMKEQVAAELAKRLADPTKVTNAVGIRYALAAGGLCKRDAPAEMKRKGFELGKKLVDARVPDGNTRRSALDVLVSCDPVAGQNLLGALARDKEKFVAEGAKKALEELKKKKK